MPSNFSWGSSPSLRLCLVVINKPCTNGMALEGKKNNSAELSEMLLLVTLLQTEAKPTEATAGCPWVPPPCHMNYWQGQHPWLALQFAPRSKFSLFPVHVHPALQPGLSAPTLLLWFPRNGSYCHSNEPCENLADEGPSGFSN